MAKSNIELSMSIGFDRLNAFIQEIQELEEKYKIEAIIDKDKNIVKFDLIELIDFKTKLI